MVRRYLLVWCFLTTCTVSGQTVTYGLQGQDVNLKPHVTGQPDDILWTHDGNKVVEFNGQEERTYNRYQNRVILDWVTAELHITDLTYEDSGEYELEVYISKKLTSLHYKLEVIGKVAKPTISCEIDHGSSDVNRTQAALMCSSDSTYPQSLVEFEWDSHGNVQPGPNLTISLRDEHDDKTYTCTATNPLSTETATFTAKDCYSGRSSSTAQPASIAVPIILILVAVAVVVVVCIVYCKLKHKVCFASRHRDDEEKWLQHGKTHGTTEARLTQGNRNDVAESLQHESYKETDTLLEQTSPSSFLDETPQKDFAGNVRAKEEKFEQLWGPPVPQRNTQNNISLKSKKPGPPAPPKKPSVYQKKPPSNNKGDADADQFSGSPETKDLKVESSVDKPEPELVDSEDTQPNVEPASAPEPPEIVPPLVPPGKPASAPEQPESEKEEDENEKGKSPTAQPQSLLTRNAPDMRPEDAANEQEEEANSDQVNGETSEREPDSAGSKKKKDDSIEEEKEKTTPEQNSSEAASQEPDPKPSPKEVQEDEQLQMDKPVPKDETETGTVSDKEEKDTEHKSSDTA